MTIIEFSTLQADCMRVILSASLIAGCIYFTRLTNLRKAIMFYMGLMLLTDLASYYMGKKWRNNHIMLHVYSLTELAFMIYFYQKHMFRKIRMPLLILGLLGLLYISGEIVLYYIIKPVSVKQFQPYAKIADNFVVIIMALTYMQERINRFRDRDWSNFGLNVVFLVFFTLTSIIFIPFNFLVNAPSDVKFYFWTINGSLISLLYLYLSFKMITPFKKRTLAQS